MTKKEIIKKIDKLDKQIYELEKEMRTQKKQNKIQKFEANEQARKIKEEIINKRSNIFKLSFVSGVFGLGAVLSLVLGGITSAVAIGLTAGFGVLAMSGVVLTSFVVKNKLKLERKLIIVEDKIAFLNNVDYEKPELEKLQDEKEKYMLVLDAINEESEKKQLKNKTDKSINVLKAVQLAANTKKYDDGTEYDASAETVLNYQKALAKKSDELTK